MFLGVVCLVGWIKIKIYIKIIGNGYTSAWAFFVQWRHTYYVDVCRSEFANCASETIVENIIVIYLVGSEFIPANFTLSYFPRQFTIVLFLSQLIDSAHLFSTDPLLSYINRCTAHNSAVSFWTRNRLDQMKVITRAIISILYLRARSFHERQNYVCYH
jgi:hypothetical protein